MKHIPKRVVYFTLVIILPMIPVIIFYMLFEQYNYFELEETVKGYVASGPIAAYVVLLGIGWQIFKGISTRETLSTKHKFLIGDWTIKSTSTNSNTTYAGLIKIQEDDHSLAFSGSFQKDGKLVATVTSVAVVIKNDSIIHLIYNMEDSRNSNNTITGYSRLTIATETNLKGLWSVTGSEEFGVIEYQKNTSNA